MTFTGNRLKLRSSNRNINTVYQTQTSQNHDILRFGNPSILEYSMREGQYW